MHAPSRTTALYVVVVTLVGYIFLEMATRLIVSGKNYEPAVPGSIVQFDELLGWSLKPLACATSSRTGYEIPESVN